MKNRFLLALCLTLCFMLMLSTALAASPKTAIVKSIAAAFDAKDWMYTVRGMVNDDKDESLSITFDTEHAPDGIKINIFARESAERVQLVVWDIIKYSDADFSKVLRAVNTLNDDYVYVKFYCDESDNTVTAQFDAYVTESEAGEIVVNMVNSMVDIVDNGYEALSVYDS